MSEKSKSLTMGLVSVKSLSELLKLERVGSFFLSEGLELLTKRFDLFDECFLKRKREKILTKQTKKKKRKILSRERRDLLFAL